MSDIPTFTFICDVCGSDKDIPEFHLSLDYGGDDECYGSTGNNNVEQKLYDTGEDWDILRGYLAQGDIHICSECHNYDDWRKPNYIHKFEQAFRKSRAKIILKLYKDKKLPEFSPEIEQFDKKIEEVEKETKDLETRLVKNIKEDLTYCHILSDLIGWKEELRKLKGKRNRL